MTHIPYCERFGYLPDFEVTYRIYSAEECGRKTPAFQGIRWDFMYEEYPGEAFMIPEILDVKTKQPLISEIPIPEYGVATMWIVAPQLRPMHRQRLNVGTRGYFIEGNRKVGVCEVTQIIGLLANPAT